MHSFISFELSPEDPNYNAYIEGAPEEMLQSGEPIKYYVLQAEKLKQDEKVTMFIDFSHLLNYRFEDQGGFSFVTGLVKEYNRFEVYLRKAITQFMNDLGH